MFDPLGAKCSVMFTSHHVNFLCPLLGAGQVVYNFILLQLMQNSKAAGWKSRTMS